MLGSIWGEFCRVLQFVRFSHTIFALPFALGSMLVAGWGFPSLKVSALIVLCMILARTAAMLFNRIADWEIDRKNPRTAGRHLLLSRGSAVIWLMITSAGFVATTWWINALCFWLSPVALVIIFLYSLTKRFTQFTQLYLGLALAVAPVGAWLAVTGSLAWPPLILASAVLFWVAGFDLIYATQDVDFDRKEGLKSMVVWLGLERSLQLALLFHLAMWLLLGLFAISAGLQSIFGCALLVIAGTLFYEHRIAATKDLNRVNAAFFSANAVVGAVFLIAIVLEVSFFAKP